MENPLSKSQKLTPLPSKFFKSKSINIITNNSNRSHKINTKNKIISHYRPKTSKTLNYNISKKSNSNLKLKNNESIMRKPSASTNKKNQNNNIKTSLDFSKFNTQKIEYDINKNLCKSTNFQGKSFLSRMELDIKNRQSKEEKRKQLLEEYKPKAKEEERVKCFNRLISDSNKRNKIKEKIEKQNEFLNCGISPKKISKKQWDSIYNDRFYKYQEKKDNNLREKIIENEKMIKQKEEDIIEQINCNTKKVNKKDLDKIINRLYSDSKKKKINKKLDNILLSDKDKANGMKKEETSNIININNNNIDISNLTRGKKPHYTIKSTKIREKKNSYFGSVIIKTSTFQQGKTNSLIKFIQNIGKSENKLEKRHTIQTVQKEIKEIENENLNISNLDSNLYSNLKYNNNNNKNDNNIKKKKKDKFELKRVSDFWANEAQIKKSKSLKRVVLINDFNNPNNIKFNVSPNYKNKKIQKNKKINNGLNIIDSEYYKNIDEDEDNSDSKINDININEIVINDLKNNMNKKNINISVNKNKNKHFNSPTYRNKYNINNINNFNNKKNNAGINIKEKKKNNNNNRRYIDEISAMKIVEDIFVNKIKK